MASTKQPSEPLVEKRSESKETCALEETLASSISSCSLQSQSAHGRRRPIELSRLLVPHPRIATRGLVNAGNMCFLNAILQALLYCNPLANLLRFFHKHALLKEPFEPAQGQRVPYLHALVTLYREFQALDGTGSLPLTPSSMHSVLTRCSRPSSPFSVSGLQEDAEEFLTHLLAELHAELLESQDALAWSIASGSIDHAEGEAWLEVGPQRRIAASRVHAEQESPISLLFSGRLKSILRTASARDSITTEPFQCLPLEIDSDSVVDIPSAIDRLTAPETLERSEGKRRSKQVLLDALPPVLVLQIKRFVYRAGVQKLLKPIDVPERLPLRPQWMSEAAKQALRDKAYRLRSVVYHLGRQAGGGHYTAHCRPLGLSADGRAATAADWLYLDDSSVSRAVFVGAEREDQTPYLVFYEVEEGIGGMEPPSRNRIDPSRTSSREERPVAGSRFAQLASLPPQ